MVVNRRALFPALDTLSTCQDAVIPACLKRYLFCAGPHDPHQGIERLIRRFGQVRCKEGAWKIRGSGIEVLVQNCRSLQG